MIRNTPKYLQMSAVTTPSSRRLLTRGGLLLPTAGRMSWTMLGIVLLLAWAPLPFGSVTPFWKAVLASGSLLLLAATALTHPQRFAWPPAGLPLLGLAAALFVIVCLWVFLQAMPFMPSAWHHPAWALSAEATGTHGTSSISINPGATLADMISLLGIGAIFLLALTEARDAVKARILVGSAAAIALAYAVYGLIVFLSGNSSVAWVSKTAYLQSLTSSFINRNTYAVYAGLGMVSALALLLSTLAPVFSSRGRAAERWKKIISYLTGSGGLWLLAVLFGLSAMLMTGSRAGTAASLLGAGVVAGLYLAARRTRTGNLVAFMLAALVAGAAFLALSGDMLVDRLTETGRAWEARNTIYELTLIAIGDHLWLGSGYGSFEDIFRMYAGLSDTYGPTFKAAHSVYLETVLELGLPAALALFGAVACCLWLAIRGMLTRRRDRIYPALAIGATLIVALQGAVDFAIQTPAITMLYTVLLAVGVAQSVSSTSATARRVSRSGDH